MKKLKIELSPGRELKSAHERAPQMEPENWVTHGKHKNEARGALRSPTWVPDGAPRGQNGGTEVPNDSSKNRFLKNRLLETDKNVFAETIKSTHINNIIKKTTDDTNVVLYVKDQWINESMYQSIDQSISQPINQSSNQSIEQ